MFSHVMLGVNDLLAYVRDPDGNKLFALHRPAK